MSYEIEKLKIERAATPRAEVESAEEQEREAEEKSERKPKPRWIPDQVEPQPRCKRRGLVTDAPLTLKI